MWSWPWLFDFERDVSESTVFEPKIRPRKHFALRDMTLNFKFIMSFVSNFLYLTVRLDDSMINQKLYLVQHTVLEATKVSPTSKGYEFSFISHSFMHNNLIIFQCRRVCCPKRLELYRTNNTRLSS